MDILFNPTNKWTWKRFCIKDYQINSATTLPELLCIIDSNEKQLITSFLDKDTKDTEYNKWISRLQDAAQLFVGNDTILLNIYHYLGKAYRRNGDFVSAKNYFEKVLELDPNYFETWNQIINKELKQIETAIAKIHLALNSTEAGKYKESLSKTLKSFVSIKEGA